jgi:hypothetical protein
MPPGRTSPETAVTTAVEPPAGGSVRLMFNMGTIIAEKNWIGSMAHLIGAQGGSARPGCWPLTRASEGEEKESDAYTN